MHLLIRQLCMVQVMEMCRTASGHGGLSLEDKILLVSKYDRCNIVNVI